MQNDNHSINEHQIIFQRTGWAFANYFLTYAQTYQDDFGVLDREFANLQITRAWLTECDDHETAQQLFTLIKALAPYLRQRALNNELLTFCEGGLSLCERIGINPGWLLLLRYEAHNALGEWQLALADAHAAVEVTQAIDLITHAQAVLALGRLQLNRGDYRIALNTLTKAENLLMEIADTEGVATTKAEIAAYYLNRSELDKALALYLEVDRFRRRNSLVSPANHTLFMLGVVYRKKGDYQKAAKYLLELLQRGKTYQDRSAIAAATHHLAWVHLNQDKLAEAQGLAEQARQHFLEIHDPRGASDTDEQLGLIALANGNTEAAQSYLEHSLAVRQQLGNQHGAASSLRHLATVSFYRGNLLCGIYNLWRSLIIYWRLRVLSPRRAFRMAKELWKWAIKREHWTT